MSDKSQFLNSITPLVDSGLPPQSLGVTQTLGGNLLTLTGPAAIQIQVNGPQTALSEDDIAGVYPAPGSTNSPDSFLAHIALNRRTLPWERSGPGGQKPWLALLLLKDSELHAVAQGRARKLVRSGPSVVSGTVQTVQSRDALGFAKLTAKMPAGTQVNLLFLQNQTLIAIRPQQDELHFLCNAKRTNSGSGDKDCAIVISNRLPDAGPDGKSAELHTAFLVSLEGRDDFYDASRALPANAHKEIGLVVLHSWNFTPSKGGDFEEVIRAIHIRPNGGVLRFGNLPKEPAQGQPVPLSGGFDAVLDEHGLFRDPLPHTQAGLVNYRGPLRPFPPAPRSPGFAVRAAPEEFKNAPPDTPVDYSHAAAFELGRLLALASHDVLEDLRSIHGTIKIIEPEVAVNKLPVALQKPDWVVNPAWNDNPWSLPAGNNATTPVIKDNNQFVGATPGDVSGINQQFQQFGVQVQNALNAMQAPGVSQVTQININTVTVEGLEKAFGNVAAKAQI
jgi:hypothetical protein